ncbi:MAG: cell wall hydrolase [Burkholderiales bacterium]|nr:MAG: cell wall hydrolase [Burkholderiales bacterium]
MKRTLAIGALSAVLLASAAPSTAATVVLDTGHTPARPGALSAAGRGEYEFNLRLSDAVAGLLGTQGTTVKRVGADGRDIALASRTNGTAGADLLVSLHHDSLQQAWIDEGRRREFAGYAVFVSRRNADVPKSELCARTVGRALLDAGERPSWYHATPIPGENRPFLERSYGAHYFDDLVVLKSSKAPAILIEAGVIANPDEETRLQSPQTVDRMARAIVNGINNCLRRRT